MDVEELSLGELAPDDAEFGDSNEGGVGDSVANRHTVVVTVFAPRDPAPKRFRFLLDEMVGEAAKVAAARFGYEVGTPSFQAEDGMVLDRTMTLRAAGVKNRQELDLVDAGGGV